MRLLNKVEELYDNLTMREQRMIVVTVLVAIIFVGAVMMFLVSNSFEARRERVRELRGALSLLMRNRNKVQETKQIMASVEMKAVKKPPMLQGHIDTIVSRYKLGSANYTPKKPRDLGENGEYRKESVEVKLHDVDLKNLSRLMEDLERGEHLILVTELKVTARRGQHDRLDPTLVVSSFYKKSAAELKSEDKKKKKNQKSSSRKK